MLFISKNDHSHHPQEAKLWRLFKSGDKNAYAQIYELYAKQLYGYAFRFLKERSMVKDCVQDLFIELWNNRQQLADVKKIKPYLFLSIRRKVLSVSGRNKNIVELDLAEEKQSYFVDSPEDLLIDGETHKIISHSIQVKIHNLPERELEAMQLRYYEWLNFSEIAEIMGITEQSVRNAVTRGIHRLRLAMRENLF